MTTSVAEAGEVIVEGEHLGRIEGFRFVPDKTEEQTDQKAVLSAALRALRENLPTRLAAFTAASDGELVFDSQLRVCWGGGPVARLLASGDVLAPKVEALASDLLDGPAREEVRKRAATWVETRIRLGLSELMDARASSEQIPAGARGIIFQLCEGLGVIERKPIEQQLGQLDEEDRKALAKLGVRVGVFTLYFPSMLKPVPIRLRAGLWMIARSRDTIPPLPAEGRTSMDLPPGSERDFYATLGYIPLGNHAIRADMVERLAAMARAAVRDSRENARRAQQEKKAEAKDTEAAAPETPAPSASGEISEWDIVAAQLGESEPAPEQAAEQAPEAAATPEPVTEETKAEEPAPAVDAMIAVPHAVAEATAEEAKPEEAAKPEEPRKAEPKSLPPGWFRATPQMMSLVGCSEPEMADVLRGLGYRVHPPTEESGPLFAFSVKPRFVREREEQRERQRAQERERRQQREQRQRERPDERQFFADAPKRDGQRAGPRTEQRSGGKPGGGKPRGDGPPQGDRRGDRRDSRPPRRDQGGPALRLYATTEKKGDAEANSPFAKLLELKLGGKK
jgi:ATP-dependent RNA helicase SUPV3L1/SUV3